MAPADATVPRATTATAMPRGMRRDRATTTGLSRAAMAAAARIHPITRCDAITMRMTASVAPNMSTVRTADAGVSRSRSTGGAAIGRTVPAMADPTGDAPVGPEATVPGMTAAPPAVQPRTVRPVRELD